MKPVTKQFALKGALFMILAANAAVNVYGHSTHASDFASTGGELGAPRATQPGRVSDGSNGAAPSTVDVAPPPPAKIGPKPDPAISTGSISAKVQIQRYCSLNFKITYIETVVAGVPKLTAQITQQSNTKRTFGVVSQPNMTFARESSDDVVRAKWDAKIKGAIIDVVTKDDSVNCSDADTAVATNVQPDDRADDRGTDRDDSRTAPDKRHGDSREDRIARGIENCTLDSRGKAMKEDDRYSCNLDRLASIDIDGDSSNDKRGSSRAMDDLADILSSLQTSIAQSMTSPDQADQRMGSARLSRVRKLLGDVRSQVANRDNVRASDSSQAVCTKSPDTCMIDKKMFTLTNIFPIGTSVARESMEVSNRIGMIDNKITQLQLDAANSQNPYQQQANLQAANQWSQMRTNPQQLQLWLSQNDAANLSMLRTQVPSLMNLTQMNGIDRNDLADFTTPYNNLLAQLGIQSQSGLSLAAPTGIVDLRAQAISQDPRSSATISAMTPQINYALLGLTPPAQTSVPLVGNQCSIGVNQQQIGGFPGQQIGAPQTIGAMNPALCGQQSQANSFLPSIASMPSQVGIYSTAGLQSASGFPTMTSTIPGRL